MIPIIYESTEKDFTNNGLGRLRDCSRCEVTEERNGVFELEFDYPVDGINYHLIQPGRLIAVELNEGDKVQPFEIVGYSRLFGDVHTFRARHISYWLNYSVTTVSSYQTLSALLTAIKSNAKPDFGFTFSTNKDSTGYTAATDGTPHSVKEILGGIEGSILDTFGGEYEFNRFNVILWKERGQYRDFTIRYGVNLVDLQDDCDFDSSYNAVRPFWKSDEESVVGDMVASGELSFNGKTMCMPLDVTDKFESKPTKAQVQSEGLSYMKSNQTWLPSQTITVDFVKLSDSPEYADFKKLEICKLCDYIKIVFPAWNIYGYYKIVKTVYDVLQERYIEMELGNLATTLSQALGLT